MKKTIIFTAFTILLALFTTANVYADTTIYLDIETSTGSLYSGNITVTPCDSDNAGTMSVTAYCAVLQSGVANTWSWFGTDAFLNSIGGLSNDYPNNIYWAWFSDLSYGNTSLSAHTLSPNERILVNYNTNPTKLTVSNSSPTQRDTVTLTLTEFSLDSNYNPQWLPATGGSVVVNGTSYNVENDGTYLLSFPNVSVYTVSGTKSGFINSNTIVLSPSTVSSGGGGGGNSFQSTPVVTPIVVKPEFDIKNAINYLKSIQNIDGSFGKNIFYSDWVAIATGTLDESGINKESLIKYLSLNNKISEVLSDNERRAMALLALKQNPYSFEGVNYIGSIINSFDGVQFGDKELVNDDIFALIPLANTGYSSNDEIIMKDISFVISKQLPNGSWNDSVDMTAAAIQALHPFKSIEGVNYAMQNAGVYLQNSQESNGGWGNAFSTSWVVQAMNVLGFSWTKNNYSPIDYLTTLQSLDGAVLQDTETLENRIWATSYAIPAILGKSWNALMGVVVKVETPIMENNKTIKTETVNTSQKVSIIDNKKTLSVANNSISNKKDLKIKPNDTKEKEEGLNSGIVENNEPIIKPSTPWLYSMVNGLASIVVNIFTFWRN